MLLILAVRAGPIFIHTILQTDYCLKSTSRQWLKKMRKMPDLTAPMRNGKAASCGIRGYNMDALYLIGMAFGLFFSVMIYAAIEEAVVVVWKSFKGHQHDR